MKKIERIKLANVVVQIGIINEYSWQKGYKGDTIVKWIN